MVGRLILYSRASDKIEDTKLMVSIDTTVQDISVSALLDARSKERERELVREREVDKELFE